jgi:hypothetical protein
MNKIAGSTTGGNWMFRIPEGIEIPRVDVSEDPV